ncbi:glycosyltransferase family 39 protein [Rhodanobacter denitrificans]|uniref:ArnT family glycosyltransferase n=1 Tax=Rhodanobacter sp. OR92 TaxID=1076524 RepID=UPI001E4C32A4|nr:MULTISPECIES: glycosyltransferase family 39 protein [Rhodanobacter]UJJ50843.1 glycosyltransferase family 39 protein [Rhodanobacter denitrificans]UJM93558.1 glycosyltransferase family 39 protein [Rhodanobacter denitrificans]UJM97089.1 glycosyltransferase family 39 protein [Rhodanobacter denitrificans]UJN20083.1 glycosyltransferase family 39 protein [Rhodanobacter denitrificans]
MSLSPSYSRYEQLRAVWPWLPLWAAVALLAIFSHGPMPLYSTRTLAVAWEMWNQGHWLVPHINGQPYSEKAPLLFWLIHAGWFAFGVSDAWPRVLEVLVGGAQLVLASLLARRLFPDRPWMAKATPWMLLAFGYAFLFGLQIMYDVLLATWALAALLCLTPRMQRAEPRWLLFGVCVGLGLLTKGPVMLLHVAFPWLLGPLWNDWADRHRARWYGRGALALLLGGAMLLAWALPAGLSGGEAYRQRLFFTQTAGRVVDKLAAGKDLQNHAEPFWFYLLWLPLMLFPFSGWPRIWVAVASLRRPLEPGLRFALCWLLPTFVVFSLISGKQLYYPLPELAGAALLMAGAIAVLRERRPHLADNGWLGTWPLGVGGIAFAVALFMLPLLVASNRLHGEWVDSAAPYSRYFSVVFLLLGGLLLLRGRGELRRLAVAGLIGVLALNALFTLTLWSRYDLRPIAHLLGAAEQAGHPLAYTGNYEGQFHFEGRLTRPISELFGDQAIQDFARAHPDGVIVLHVHRPDANDLRYALLAQPFRSSWLVAWPAVSLADLRSGHTPPEPAQPTRVYPADDWRYRTQP